MNLQAEITENFGKLPDGEAQAGLQHLLERHPRISMEELYEGKTLISKDWDTNKDCLENRTPNRSMVKFLEGADKFSINGSKHGLRTWTISGKPKKDRLLYRGGYFKQNLVSGIILRISLKMGDL